MFLEIERAEEHLLTELVAAEIRKLETDRPEKEAVPEGVSYDREERLEILERLLRRLHESEFDVTC
ncbi:MAG TPA: hypothetical protein VHC19_22450 [Pirellulales bacterium]|nr:hypothetical protein [Pirellulales bacterium]